MAHVPATGLQIRSLLGKDGALRLSLERIPVDEPKDDDVLIRVEATPINPSVAETEKMVNDDIVLWKKLLTDAGVEG